MSKPRHKRKKLILNNLQPNQVASIGDDGKIQIRSTDIRGDNNFGVVSNLGLTLNRLFLHSPPYLQSIDKDFLQRDSSPLFSDREAGLMIF